MTQTQAQKLVDRALALKVKKEKAEARYEARRVKYSTLHKKVTSIIQTLTAPFMLEIDQIKEKLIEYRKSNVESSSSLVGVSWRSGKYKASSVDLEALIKAAVLVDPVTGEVSVSESASRWLQPNTKAIDEQVGKMELLHSIPGVTAEKSDDVLVLGGR